MNEEQLLELRSMHGAFLKKERRLRSVTREEVAMALGVSENRIKRFEKGLPVNDGFMMEKAYIYFLELLKKDMCPFYLYGKFQSDALLSSSDMELKEEIK